MSWLGKVSLGGFPDLDLAGAVTKISESVKNMEKNFDNALGLEENPDNENENENGDSSNREGIWSSSSDSKTLFDPVMSFMGRAGESNTENAESLSSSFPETREMHSPESRNSTEENRASDDKVVESDYQELQTTSNTIHMESHEGNTKSKSSVDKNLESKDNVELAEQNEGENIESIDEAHLEKSMSISSYEVETSEPVELHLLNDSQRSHEKEREKEKDFVNEHMENDSKQVVKVGTLDSSSSVISNDLSNEKYETKTEKNVDEGASKDTHIQDNSRLDLPTETLNSSSDVILNDISNDQLPESSFIKISVMPLESDTLKYEPNTETKMLEPHPGEGIDNSESTEMLVSETHIAKTPYHNTDLEKLTKEMKMMESALQGAARQAQAKADEISRVMNENELLKATLEDLKKKSIEAENDALREEYHQRVSLLERKVYALTKERDTLRREQNKKSDVGILLKEKDEIISQVMAEGENLSKKQAAQEGTIRKLRAQIREFEEEKERLNSKILVEETKVESIKRDKAATEKLLQETTERNQAELAAQKEFFTNALNAAREAEALAEMRANNEAKIELEDRLRDAFERESMLVQTLEELRQTLSRTERQAVFKEDMLQKDIDDLQKRYQASELRYNELITQVPESTRPLLRQIEAMQETAARKTEAWAGVEANLNARLEAAEAKASSSEEKERLMGDRLSQTLSRLTVLETQIACLRTEQTQLNRSLEKERQRASESRQENLAAMEEVATHVGRSRQLEDELREIRGKHKQELKEVLVHKELIEKDLERERTARIELERNSHHEITLSNQDPMAKHAGRNLENGNISVGKLSSAGSLGSMEESYFLQASLDSLDGSLSDRRNSGELSHYFLKSMTPSTFEAALRQKDGELSSYISRLASLETTRDSLAEELVKMTEQCEKLRAEACLIPGLRAELEALRRRHSSALELMGERDEELEELRADIIDLKEMYREQVDLLVNKIQMVSSSTIVAT